MTSVFHTSIGNRYFEDYIVGDVHEFGSIAVAQADIIAFAAQYDPQVFHINPEAAASSVYGGLIASGWQTASLMMRLVVENYLSHVASLGSPGIEELRWLRPVRPGDVLSVRATVLDTRRSRSKPDRGIVQTLFEVLNQRREVTMSAKAVNLLRLRQR